MIWVLVFVGIGILGLVVVLSYGVWLAHKASDLFSEVVVLGERAGELGDLVSQIGDRPAIGK